MAEVTTAIVRVSANSRKSRPTMPVMKSSGMKTATSETVSDTTVKPISRAPLKAAAKGVSPASMWRVMFSIMTMASSITKPVPMASAIKERLSRLKPAIHMTPKAAISERGRATPAMKVARAERRKSRTTSTTSPTLSRRVSWTSWTEARIVPVRSLTTESVTPSGMPRCSLGRMERMPSTVSMMLAPGWRCTSMTTAGLP